MKQRVIAITLIIIALPVKAAGNAIVGTWKFGVVFIFSPQLWFRRTSLPRRRRLLTAASVHCCAIMPSKKICRVVR